jgi:hypothetical protein
LSGGDLDGDLYNVIFEPTLMPQRDIAPPADYPRVSGMELEHEVIITDMSSFFIQFMETDQLGQICSRHVQLADQRSSGVSDPDCIKLAGMASTAVDFSKTGIAVSLTFSPMCSLKIVAKVILEMGVHFFGAMLLSTTAKSAELRTTTHGCMNDIIHRLTVLGEH